MIVFQDTVFCSELIDIRNLIVCFWLDSIEAVAAERLLLRLAKENNLPADRVFPLPHGSVGQNK